MYVIAITHVVRHNYGSSVIVITYVFAIMLLPVFRYVGSYICTFVTISLLYVMLGS